MTQLFASTNPHSLSSGSLKCSILLCQDSSRTLKGSFVNASLECPLMLSTNTLSPLTSSLPGQVVTVARSHGGSEVLLSNKTCST